MMEAHDADAMGVGYGVGREQDTDSGKISYPSPSEVEQDTEPGEQDTYPSLKTSLLHCESGFENRLQTNFNENSNEIDTRAAATGGAASAGATGLTTRRYQQNRKLQQQQHLSQFHLNSELVLS